MKTKQIFIYLLTCLTLAGCYDKDMVESSDEDALTEEKVYSNPTYTRRVVYNLYGSMRELQSANNGSASRLQSMATNCALLDDATDDAAVNPSGVPVLRRHINANISANSNPVDGTHPWTWYYKAIRSANDFLANVDRSPLDAEEIASLKAEARFLRAFFYHELFRWFGALVIYEEKGDPFAFETTQRETLEQTVEWIVKEFDAVAQPGVLPDTHGDAEFGRATRGMALAYKARTLLYAASPLHAEAGSGVTWAQAAQAAWDMIQYADEGSKYELYVDPNAPELSFRHLFVTRGIDNNNGGNKEIILSYMRENSADMYNNLPSLAPWNINKACSTNPSQWLIDSYDMLDGSEPILGYRNETEPIINEASGYDEQHPYANRDPRLAQTILFDGATWPLVNGAPVKLDISTLESFRESGYFLLKFLDERIDHRMSGTTCQNFIMMRYAEVLLNYAEALNEAENSAEARQKAVTQLNRIRTRAGVGLLKAQDYDQNSLRERIRKERRVELCFEEHRFFDIKRWKIASTVMKRPKMGINKVNGVYVRSKIGDCTYNPRMNLMPIPMSEVSNCPLIYQNPGY